MTTPLPVRACGRTVQLIRPDKPRYPVDGSTKANLARYHPAGA